MGMVCIVSIFDTFIFPEMYGVSFKFIEVDNKLWVLPKN